MTPEEADLLLTDVAQRTAEATRVREEADSLSAARRHAIQAAMDAGIPREEIAAAAGVHRNVLYQILKGK